MPRTRPTILLIILAGAAFLPFLGRRDIVISHEARVAQTSRAMAASGWPWNAQAVSVPAVHLVKHPELENALRLDPDPAAPPLRVNPWLIPVLNDEIRLQKPPLAYWCSAMLYRLAGVEWSEALSRLIPALLGAAGTFLTAGLGRRVLGKRYALPAALVWVTSYFIPDEYRKCMVDPYLAFFVLLAVWSWIRGWLPLFYIAVGLGLLAKGPPLFIHLVIPIVLYHWLKRRPLPGPAVMHAAGLLLAAAITLPWALNVIHRVPHAMEFWRYESIGELGDKIENGRPWWYYAPIALQIALPWTPLLIFAAVMVLRRRRIRPALFPLAWYLIAILLFSFLRQKKAAYLLPAMPAQTLLIAQGAVAIVALLRRRVSRQNANEMMIFAAMLIVIALAGFFNLYRTRIENARSPRPACGFVRMALESSDDYTVEPGRLPPEAALYLPLDIRFNPNAHTLIYLMDDPKDRAQTDLASFERRLPNLNIIAVRPVRIPRAPPGYRYRLFILSLSPAMNKHMAMNKHPALGR